MYFIVCLSNSFIIEIELRAVYMLGMFYITDLHISSAHFEHFCSEIGFALALDFYYVTHAGLEHGIIFPQPTEQLR